MPDNVYVEETEVDAEVIRAGEAAVGVIMRTFDNWLKIGHALDVGRRISMRIAYTNRPHGRGYNAAFSQWLAAHPPLARINGATRHWLYKCLEHESEISEWLEANEAFKYNYPTTVFNRWTVSTQQTAATAPPSDLRSEIERLRQENADLRRQLNDAREVSGRYDGPSMTRRDTPPNIVRVLHARSAKG